VEFPGLIGVGLYRLGEWLRTAPLAALGPLFGMVGADIALDLSRGRLAHAGVELVIAPALAVSMVAVAQQVKGGMSGHLMFVVGTISAMGATSLLALGIAHGSSVPLVVGLRHATVAAYAWASVATEPPPRRGLVLSPVGA